jgi:hypothetical protein
MDFYPLFVFEADTLPSPIDSHADALRLVERLLREEAESRDLPANLRFARLGRLLAQKLPDEAGIFWLHRPDVTLSKCRKIWQPELRETGKIQRLLKILLPLAKELRLGVYDARFRLYVPPEAQKVEIPGQAGKEYRAELDRASVKIGPLSDKQPREAMWVSMTLRAARPEES